MRENIARFQKKFGTQKPRPPIITISEQLKLETDEEKRQVRERERQREYNREQAKKELEKPKTNLFWEVKPCGSVEEKEYSSINAKPSSWVPRWLEKEWPDLKVCLFLYPDVLIEVNSYVTNM